jgi:hypothetical protein
MSSSPSAPPPPNYQPLADASQAAARESAQVMREQLAWAKTQYKDNKIFTDEVKQRFLEDVDTNRETARRDRARYEEIYQPLEDDLAHDAETFGGEGNKERYRGRAMGTVSQQFEQAGQVAKRNLEGFGIDPTATRYGALDVGVRTAKAAALAAAANNSDMAVEDRGRALRSEAINVGRGYPGQIATQYGTSTQAGTGAVGGQNQTYSASAPALGNPTAWGGLQNQSLGVWGNTLSNMYGSQIAGFNAQTNANAQANSGIGAAAGMLGGIALKGAMGGFKEGGQIPEPSTAPGVLDVEGTAIPRSASPSGGAVRDDIQAVATGSDGAQRPVNVDAGEFVFPRDVTAYYGQKNLVGMIHKARQDMDGGMAPKQTKTKGALPVGGADGGGSRAALPV